MLAVSLFRSIAGKSPLLNSGWGVAVVDYGIGVKNGCGVAISNGWGVAISNGWGVPVSSGCAVAASDG